MKDAFIKKNKCWSVLGWVRNFENFIKSIKLKKKKFGGKFKITYTIINKIKVLSFIVKVI